jgi:hypothetical protein
MSAIHSSNKTNPTITTDAQIGRWRILTVVHRRALARCDCGTVREVAVAALEDGSSTSCGCFSRNERVVSLRLPGWRPERGR